MQVLKLCCAHQRTSGSNFDESNKNNDPVQRAQIPVWGNAMPCQPGHTAINLQYERLETMKGLHCRASCFFFAGLGFSFLEHFRQVTTTP